VSHWLIDTHKRKPVAKLPPVFLINVANDEIKSIYQALRNLQAIVDVLQWIANRFDRAVDAIEKQQAIDDIIRELQDYLTTSQDRIDRMLLLILERLPEKSDLPVWAKRETAELKQQTIESRLKSLQLQKAQFNNNLNTFEEQAAQYGFLVPIELKNKIEWSQDKLRKIDDELEYLRKNYGKN
jgi:hypothetical protein